MDLYGRNSTFKWGDMKGAERAVRARLIPSGGNRGPVFSFCCFFHKAVCHMAKLYCDGGRVRTTGMTCSKDMSSFR